MNTILNVIYIGLIGFALYFAALCGFVTTRALWHPGRSRRGLAIAAGVMVATLIVYLAVGYDLGLHDVIEPVLACC